jgi:hypothetical protein
MVTFQLGLIDEQPSGKKTSPIIITGVLATYRETNGLPAVTRLTYCSDDRVVSLSLEGNTVSFQKNAVTPATSPSELNDRLLGWAADHLEDRGSTWVNIGFPKGFDYAQMPIFLLLTIAANKDADKKNSKPFVVSPLNEALVWIAPIRSKPRRTYDEPHTVFSPEGSHTPYVIRRMLSSAKEAEKFKKFMEDVSKNSGLFEKIEIKYFGPALETSPFEVDEFVDGKPLSLGWMGYGVSQSLPIFVELLDRPRGTAFAIQQPEVHLHPRAQACLGDVFFEMAIRDKKTFIVETHSDFAIDRFRMNFRRRRSRKKSDLKPLSQILFFERREAKNTVTPIRIGDQGDMPADQPESYRRFFVKEEMRLLGF